MAKNKSTCRVEERNHFLAQLHECNAGVALNGGTQSKIGVFCPGFHI